MTTITAPTKALELIGLFPSWDPGPIGGVQRSGREAWEAVVARTGSEGAKALCYEPGTSKAGTVLRAMKTTETARTILVWHLDLLKLLPFLDASDSRIVLFLHGIEAWRRHDLVTQWLLKRVRLFLTNTDHTWNEFLRYNPVFTSVPHTTVHLGLDAPTNDWSQAPDDVPAALMLSRLDARQDYKGHRPMIAAWPKVVARIPNAQLWVAGGGDLQLQLELLVRDTRLQESVRFLGEISTEKKDELMARCRCFAMPSRGDGFGLVYLEAMRVGRPCLVSTIDAGREVVNPPEAGLSVDPTDEAAVAEGVARLLTPGPGWDAWSVRARRRYESQFTCAGFRQRLATALSI